MRPGLWGGQRHRVPDHPRRGHRERLAGGCDGVAAHLTKCRGAVLVIRLNLQEENIKSIDQWKRSIVYLEDDLSYLALLHFTAVLLLAPLGNELIDILDCDVDISASDKEEEK